MKISKLGDVTTTDIQEMRKKGASFLTMVVMYLGC